MWGEPTKNARKFFGFCTRELVERGRGASVIRQNPADFARNTFELRPIHTAKIENRILEPKLADHDACIILLMSRGIELWIDPCVLLWVGGDGMMEFHFFDIL